MTEMTGRERFLAALHGAPHDRVPVWFMRQAGRHLPEYRKLRTDVDFWSALMDPETAREITLQPVRRYGVDAAVLFSDIMVSLPSIGAPVAFVPGKGPRVEHPITAAEDVERLTSPGHHEALEATAASCAAVREAAPDTALVGFAGAPFTLAAYLVEGGGSKDWNATRTMLYAQPDIFDRLLEATTEAALAQLEVQRRAGADVLQVFDSWAGVLDATTYRRRVLPHMERIVKTMRARGAPCIVFAKGSPHLLPVIAELEAEAFGVDWRLSMEAARQIVGTRCLQGNLDPALMGAPPEVAVAAAREAMKAARSTTGGHILNTGHGLAPTARTDTVAAVVREAHATVPGTSRLAEVERG